MFAYEESKQKQASKNTFQKKETEKPVVKPNLTGIPDGTKTRFENISRFSFDDVRVHYNSEKPAQLQALAYTQGNQVHVAPGQEKHLGHELGHVVQQKAGRVLPTMQLQGMNVNDNEEFEKEADSISTLLSSGNSNTTAECYVISDVIQRLKIEKNEITLDLSDLNYKVLAGALCGKSDAMMVSNAEYVEFLIEYEITNHKDSTREITIGLVQRVLTDNVFGRYENADGEEYVHSFGVQVPFIDASEDTSPFYDKDSFAHCVLEDGEVFKNTISIKDRSNIAIPLVIHQGQTPYNCKSLYGERVFKIELHVFEADADIIQNLICEWKYNIEDGKVTCA